jgi:PH (Pleckstrin Homology) domain-containing protein
MSYLRSNLVPGEKVIYQTRLHWVVMLGNLLVGCLLLAPAGAALLYYAYIHPEIQNGTLRMLQGGGVALLVCALVVIVVGMVRRNATEMAVTNRRVVVKRGLASRKTIEMLLNKVESIEVRETTLGRLLGYGAIVVVGTGGSTEPFEKIAHPLTFRSRLQQQIEQPISPLESTPVQRESTDRQPPALGTAVR